jgi:hypothetical protein
MSTTSRSRTARALLALATAAVCAAGYVALPTAAAATANAQAASAPQLPPVVEALVPGGRLQGQGELTWLGLSIYRGYLWSPAPSWTRDRPFALDLHYSRALKGELIAERSVEEIRGIGLGTAETRARWSEQMRRIFPDVREGDRLTGVHLPGYGARFFHNGRAIGDVADPGFAEAFFGIWLHPKTSRPDFRRRLLGE